MGRNCSKNAQKTKEVVRYLYFLAKRKGYLDEIMKIAGVTNVKSLQWSYTNGRISEEQIAGYVNALGVNRDFIIGVKDMTSEDKKALEFSLSNKGIEDNIQIERVKLKSNFHLVDKYKNIIEEAGDDELKSIKTEIQILTKYIEIRELKLGIK